MEQEKLEMYWNNIPVGKENALSYSELCFIWSCNERRVRSILHELSYYDNGDDYVLIRSGTGKGFYKTDDPETLKSFKKECLNKGKSVFAPVKKINRVLNANVDQISFENNLRVVRESKCLKQKDVCLKMQEHDKTIDTAMLSKMENNVCFPTPLQLALFAQIYDVKPSELIDTNLYY